MQDYCDGYHENDKNKESRQIATFASSIRVKCISVVQLAGKHSENFEYAVVVGKFVSKLWYKIKNGIY